MDALLLKFMPVIIIAFVGVILFAFYKNGWDQLAKYYRLQGNFPENVIRFTTGNTWVVPDAGGILWNGKARSNLPIKVAADQLGLYLAPISFDRIYHPPLFIPWEDISDSWFEPPIVKKLFSFVEKLTGAKMRAVLLEIKKTPGIAIEISEFIAQRIKENSYGGWKSKTV